MLGLVVLLYGIVATWFSLWKTSAMKYCTIPQGNRVLTKERLEQVILNPAGFQPFTLKSPFQAGLLLQQIEGYLAQDCQVLGTMVLADPAVIFSKGNIQRPVQAVFDAPMSAGSLQ